jgi:regulator of protease activity HflC (stomatin/prohibitin superfamily)
MREIVSGPGILVAAVVALIFLFKWVNVLNEYERAVTFWLGRLGKRPKGPGLVLIFWPFERMVRISLRTVVHDVPAQDIITRDNVSVKVNAVVYFRVVEPEKAVVSVENYLYATSQLAQTTLRSVLGQALLDELLSEREKLNLDLQKVIDEHTQPWGIKVSLVEVKQVDLPLEMQRAMAKQAEAEREKRAKIIHAEGEFQASERLRDAADVISGNPASLQLRYLQTLTEIGATQNSTVVFPLPLDVIKPFLEALQPADQRAVSRSPETETISSSRSPSLTRPEPAGDQRSVVAAGRSDGPGP